ncbi:hypothetical protein H9L17_07705 [Thermomonas brevis]|uniref:Uncharacterized protein n=1 Tax=Thermomonas brevis TaxID=215691 RepID=A0A7G9QXB9_9GAMM|nr:DUF6683 family protein [Thermomonas brevis]QNN47994.1 hypothetical protein H9L17_07705 [Thermomonas brevis]
MRPRHAALLALLAMPCIALPAQAQRSSYQMMQDTNRMLMNRVNGKMAPSKPAASAVPASPAATRFTPVAGDDSVKQLADSLGNTPEERGQILQLAGAGKEIFAQKYKGKWDNTLAGAMTFFVVAAYIVDTEQQPSAEAENALFNSLNAMLAQSDIVRASNAEKTGLYNVLLASAGLPLVIYVEGKEKNNAGLVEQSKVMAAGFGRKLFNMEMRELTGMLGAGGGAGTPVASAPTTQATASGGATGLDGRYDCQMAALQFDGVSYVTQYRPTGMWFTIKGGTYSAQSGGGRIEAGGDVVGFHSGTYDGWRGARRGEAIVFRKNDYGNPRPGESIKSGDFRCGRRSG